MTVPVRISVILGRVSTEDGERVLETIAALEPERLAMGCEIVIADRIQDKVSDRIKTSYPHVRLIPCPSDMSLPKMRTLAFRASSGSIVAVTEDHCVPQPGWLSIVSNAFDNGGTDLVAVGGSVANGVTVRGLDWATFLCEYSYFSPPVFEGATPVLPGMNIAYRRSVLEEAPDDVLTSGFWETTLHPRLLSNGGALLSMNALRMNHCKKFSMRLFMAQRFLYSRYYAGVRFQNAGYAKRLAAAAGALLLPPILLWRMTGAAQAKGLGHEFRLAFPALLVFVFVWSVGEAVGSLLGPGDALARIE